MVFNSLSPTEYNGELKAGYEMGFGISIGIYETAATRYKTGCSVKSAAQRRSTTIVFEAIMRGVSETEASSVTAASDSVTPTRFVDAVTEAQTVSNASFAVPLASSMTVVPLPSPPPGPATDTAPLIAVIVVLAMCILGAIGVAVVTVMGHSRTTAAPVIPMHSSSPTVHSAPSNYYIKQSVQNCTATFYHGTSLEAALSIQREGFRVDLSGSNAGAALGNGVYVTTTLEKALNYAKPNPHSGVIFELNVDLGRCYEVQSSSDSNIDCWQTQGYDSARAKAGVIGVREENCVKDPGRVKIINAIFGHTQSAHASGYAVHNGRVVRTE